jgi:hypothetical protein
MFRFSNSVSKVTKQANRAFSTQTATHVDPELLGIYPVPKSDVKVKEGILKWRQHVVQRKYCPFVNSFGSKFSVEVERSPNPHDWMRHVYLFLGDSELSTMLLTLPTHKVPTADYLTNGSCLSGEGSMMLDLFGPSLLEFRVLMTSPHQIRTSAHKKGVLVDVAFHPAITNSNWAPWPTIQLVKIDVMEASERWYEKKHGCPVSKIVMDNNSNFLDLTFADQQRLLKERQECYL